MYKISLNASWKNMQILGRMSNSKTENIPMALQSKILSLHHSFIIEIRASTPTVTKVVTLQCCKLLCKCGNID